MECSISNLPNVVDVGPSKHCRQGGHRAKVVETHLMGIISQDDEIRAQITTSLASRHGVELN